jgi:RNA polymerase sigma factor (sigma-70 family)
MAAPDRRRLAAWIATSVMPHEASVRGWLRQRMASREDVDDLVQEAYARFASLTAFEQIAEPRRYFHEVARNLLIDHIRRQRIVRIDAVADIEVTRAMSRDPDPEQITAARRELARVFRLIEALPDRCRQVFTLRKVEGLSQREIALRLNVNESVVENDGVKGLRLIMKAMREQSCEGTKDEESLYGRPAER